MEGEREREREMDGRILNVRSLLRMVMEKLHTYRDKFCNL
jgi:hypothetical protein